MRVKRYTEIDIPANFTEATLLSVEETKKLPEHLRQYDCWWWLRSPGFDQDSAASVDIDGSVFYLGDNVCSGNNCVRPALKISNLESADLQIGDRFEFGGVEFEVISDDLAFCVTDIGCCAFRKNWKADDANDYEVSDVKQFVDNWFKNASANKGTSRKEMTRERMKALLNQIIDYVSVANDTAETIETLLRMGFTKEELEEEFSFSSADLNAVEDPDDRE